MVTMALMPCVIFGQISPTFEPIDSPTATKKRPHPINPKRPGGPKASHDSGSVTAIDPSAGTITIKDTYYVTNATKIASKGKTIAVSDIKVGDTVSITYIKDGGKLVASRITITNVAKNF
jgi:sugar lactone lactonase YvrE